MIYGIGGKATSTVVFLIGPLMLTNSARIEDARDEAEWGGLMTHLLPTSVPSAAIAFALLMQCIAAPLLGLIADRFGMRRILLSLHVALGLACNVALGLTDVRAPTLLRAALLAGLYYSMALAWMFQNALLPSVALSAHRPTVSLVSAGLSNLGALGFLLVQYSILRAAGGSADPGAVPPESALDLITLLAAAVRTCVHAHALFHTPCRIFPTHLLGLRAPLAAVAWLSNVA